jgi:hypothetical protein
MVVSPGEFYACLGDYTSENECKKQGEKQTLRQMGRRGKKQEGRPLVRTAFDVEQS